MSGFMSSSASMTICKCQQARPLDVEALRKGAFTEAIDPDGIRSGWVGLNDLLDTDNFFLATSDARFSGFSYRLDMRRPAAAVIRLQLAEQIRAEEAEGKKIGSKRKKELREAIIEKLTARADFVPSLTDCIWDGKSGVLFIGTTSEKMLERILSRFKGSFGMDAAPIGAEKDMETIFSLLQNEGSLQLAGYNIAPMGSASLQSADASSEKSAIAVRNSPDAVSDGLSQGLAIKRMGIIATNTENEDDELQFTLDSSLAVSGLKFPRAEKGMDEEATFLINAEICASVAALVDKLAGNN